MPARASSEDLRRGQYGTPGPLSARFALHRRFSVNPQGWTAWLFAQLRERIGARTLEIGCGTGALWAENAGRIPAPARLVLGDFSRGMVRHTREALRGQGVRALCAVLDAHDLPWPDASFGLVAANHMLYHVADRPRALAEIRRVLVPGGWLVASTLSEHNMGELWSLASEAAGRELRVAGLTEQFSLENGADQLGAVFTRVELRRYPDALEITEVEPVLDYLRSLTDAYVLSEPELAAVAARVRSQIDTHGAFHVGKDAGVFMVC